MRIDFVTVKSNLILFPTLMPKIVLHNLHPWFRFVANNHNQLGVRRMVNLPRSLEAIRQNLFIRPCLRNSSKANISLRIRRKKRFEAGSLNRVLQARDEIY